MRRAAVAAAVVGMLGLAAVGITSTTSQAAEPAAAARKVLRFDVAFSPLSLIAANNERTPGSPFALGDEITFHDQLSVQGKRVGDEVGSCVLAELDPEPLANCSLVIRVPGGSITGQFASSPGPAPKPIAITGGTGVYRNAGGEGTLVEFANQTGVLTLRVLALSPRT
jgi:hypothetical protein